MRVQSGWNKLLPLVVMFVLFYFLEQVHALHVFDAYRMIQMNEGTNKVGSQRSLVNLLAAPALTLNTTLSRTIAVIPFDALDVTTLTDILQVRHADALLVLLPPNFGDVSQEVVKQWEQVEQAMLKMEVQVPAYFAPCDEQLKGVYEYLLKHGEESAGDKYQLVVSSSDISVVKDPIFSNFQGWLAAAPSAEEGRKATIAIVAYYDSFGIAPGLATGVDSNGSGVTSVLELARIFSKFYSDVKTRGKYNIVFVLTSAGSLNYAGTGKWLDERSNAGVLDNIEFALCLDSLGGSELYLQLNFVLYILDFC